MEPKIRILDPHISNQIAAGEVVERPASVVKELIENSIDAGSTKIYIEVSSGGLDTIKVSDNGDGMIQEDAELAFVRHATSKIKTGSDLYNIKTMGFRGEALPSIAAVSRVQLSTRTVLCSEGTKLVMEAGKLISKEPVGCPVGTTVLVENLFFNTPARKKFLKSVVRENAAVANIVSKIALINAHISFKLVVDGRVVLQTSGNNILLESIALIYHTDLARNLIPFNYEGEAFSLAGYIGQSFQHRANRGDQNFFVNKRFIQSLKLSKALETGYGGVLPVKRYPLCIINIDIQPALVDINVHPTKLEVRLADEDNFMQVFANSISKTLYTFNQVKTTVFASSGQQERGKQDEMRQCQNSNPQYLQEDLLPYQSEVGNEVLKDEVAGIEQVLANTLAPNPTEAKQTALFAETSAETRGQQKLRLRNILGQLHNTYIVAQDENGLILIDQHAAHERILFEEYSQRYLDQQLYSQSLTVPLNLELNYLEAANLVESIFLFSSLGIIVEHFGGNTFLIRSLPYGFSPQEGLELIESLLSEIQTTKKQSAPADYLKLLACKKAVKAGMQLSLQEMDTLLKDLNNTEFPFTCPHGRPTIISLGISDIAKKFLRT